MEGKEKQKRRNGQKEQRKPPLLFLCLLLCLLLTACGGGREGAAKAQWQAVLSQRGEESVKPPSGPGWGEAAESAPPSGPGEGEATEPAPLSGPGQGKTTESEPPVVREPADFDLTVMSADTAYAAVCQMINSPKKYEGKTVRMQGLYYSGTNKSTGEVRHYCILQNSMACCTQGLEFTWSGAPGEMPGENTGIVVRGVFETYQREGKEKRYCRLREAVLEETGAP